MYRAIPSANKILTKKWNDKAQQRHIDTLRNIKSSIDKAPPKQPKHLVNKVKRHHMMEGKLLTWNLTVSERYTEIERENRILLEKMTNILQK